MSKNVNISIIADNRQAISQTSQMSDTLISLNKIVNNTQVSLQNSDMAWSTYFQGLNSGLEILKKVGDTAKSAFDFLREGADYAEAEQNFKAYTQSIGKDAESMMAAFRKASKNQLSDIELMKSATNALKNASITDIDAIAKLYEIADAKGDLLGMSLQETFDKIVSAITQGNGRALIELGLLPDKFNRASDATALLKNRTLVFQEVLKKGSEDIAALSSVGDTASDTFNQLEAAVTNLNNEFKKELSDVLTPLLDFIKTDGIPVAKSALELLKDGIKSAKEMQSSFGLLTTIIESAAGAMVLMTGAKIVNGIMKLSTATTAAKDAMLLFNSTLLANPYTLAAVGLVALCNYTNKLQEETDNANKAIETNIKTLEKMGPAGRKSAAELKISFKEMEIAALGSVEKIDESINSLLKKAEARNKSRNQFVANHNIQGRDDPGTFNYEADLSDARTLSKLYSQKDAIVNAKKELEKLKLEFAETSNADYSNSLDGKKNDIAEPIQNLKTATVESIKLFQSLGESIKAAYLENRNFESSIKGLSEGFKTVYSSAISLFDKAKFGDNSAIVGVFEDIAKAAAETVNELERLSPEFEKLIKLDLPEALFIKDAVDYLQKGLKATVFKEEETSISKMFGFDVLANIYKSASTTQSIDRTADKIHNEFKDAISSSISEGFARADFSGFIESFGSGIKGVVGGALGDTINSLFKQENMGSLTSSGGLFKQIYSKNSSGNTSLNWSALASNVGIGLGLSFLTGEGGLLGKRKIVGAENINKSSELNAQVDQAKALRDEMFLAMGVSEYTRQLMNEAEFAYTWVTSSKSGSIFNRKKTYTIHNQEAAQSSVKYLEELQAKALDEQAQRSFATFNLGRGDSIGAAAANYADAQSAYNASQTLLYGGKTKAQVEAEIAAKNTQSTTAYNNYAQFANLANQFGGNIGSYYKGLANKNLQDYKNLTAEITKLTVSLSNPEFKYSLAERTQMQQQLEESKIALAEARQTARTGLTSSVLSSSTLASMVPQNRDLMNMLLGNADVAANSSMIKTMLPLLEKAGFQDFNLTKAFADAGNDPEKMLAAYESQQNILQKASSVYEQLYKDAKAESLNSNLAVEEQMAAFERFQDSFNSFLEIQNQILTNTQTIADIEKQNFSKSLTTDLSDALSVFAETVMQTNGSKTEVYYQTLSATELLAKLKAILKENKTSNADALITAINELEELESWGD